ncbi:hypothetical protein O181_101085 [Austropuccinia psidii MF-1]|uniref:Uncharacterized protein n=1 Tax=Austropuccinia psidii MF-1 TaxID=1389203 RepID=A0A9Q3JGV6_9BASI|nr:hypothetical protein [Austropuccinia psidii MF-1]
MLFINSLPQDIFLRASFILSLFFAHTAKVATTAQTSSLDYNKATAFISGVTPSEPVKPTGSVTDPTPGKLPDFNWDSILKKQNVTCSLSYGTFNFKYEDSVSCSDSNGTEFMCQMSKCQGIETDPKCTTKKGVISFENCAKLNGPNKLPKLFTRFWPTAFQYNLKTSALTVWRGYDVSQEYYAGEIICADGKTLNTQRPKCLVCTQKAFTSLN